MRTLNGARVLITGSAQGIGRELALVLAREGAQLILTDINEAKLVETRGEVEAMGARCWSYPLDVTDEGMIARVREQIHGEGGRITILVNNAGVVFGGPFLEVPLARHQQTLRINTLGVLAMTHAFLPDLLEAPAAHLVNIASAAGLVGLPSGASYAASKWAVIGFSESIRLELRLQGQRQVGVTTVCPSYVATGMFAGVKPPRTTAMLDPRRLARRIVQAVQRNEVFVYEPWMVKMTPLLKGLLPPRAVDLVSDLLQATSSMTGWSGHRQG